MAAYLNEKIQGGQPATAPSAKSGESSEGGCPFSAMVAQMGLGSSGTASSSEAAGGQLSWTADARERLERLPSFVQPMVRSSVETYAKKHGLDVGDRTGHG